MARNTTTRKSTTTRTRKAAQPKPAPTEPKVEAKPAPSNCKCGCGQPTITAKAQFVAGHDARLAGRLGRLAAEDGLTTEDLALLESLSDRLQDKVKSVEITARKKAAVKAARVQAESVAKAAYEQAMADILAHS